MNMRERLRSVFGLKQIPPKQPDFNPGDILIDQRRPWVRARIVRVVTYRDEPHYELVINCPGLAPRAVELSEDGLRMKFRAQNRKSLKAKLWPNSD